jgi:hypothetical protein
VRDVSQEAEDWGGWTGCPHRPSCRSLLDPHTREFPDGLCYETARATCELFAFRHVRLTLSDPPERWELLSVWCTSWPLLVGDIAHPLPREWRRLALWALPSWVWQGQVGDGTYHLPRLAVGKLALLPGPGVSSPWAMAGLVVVKETEDGQATLFGLMQPEGEEMAVVWRFVRPVVVAEGKEALAEAQRLYDWYARVVEGKRLRGRRPTFESRSDLLDTLVKVAASLQAQGITPTREAVALALADALDVTRASEPVDTLKKWLRRHRLRWQDVLDRLYS